MVGPKWAFARTEGATAARIATLDADVETLGSQVTARTGSGLFYGLVMIGAVPRALDGDVPTLGAIVGAVVVSPLGKAVVPVPAVVDDPPVTQPEVDAAVEPVPKLDCVPPPVHAVPADRVEDSLIAPDTLGTAVFVGPTIGTALPMPDDGDAGTWLPPPGRVVWLVATVLFGFAKVDGGGNVVEARPVDGFVDSVVLPGAVELRPPMGLVCANAAELPAIKAATASEVKSVFLFMVRVSREISQIKRRPITTVPPLLVVSAA